MLDFDAQAQLAGATAELMRSCAVATAYSMTTSAYRGLTLWSDMFRVPDVRRTANPFETFWRLSPAGWLPKAQAWPIADLGAWNPYAAVWKRAPYTSWTPFATWNAASWPGWTAVQSKPSAEVKAPTNASGAAVRKASPSGLASYRSAGGHAVAQVIMGPMPDPAAIASLTTATVFTPMQTMLGVWRAALGA
jgi:hypothetical protein